MTYYSDSVDRNSPGMAGRATRLGASACAARAGYDCFRDDVAWLLGITATLPPEAGAARFLRTNR